MRTLFVFNPHSGRNRRRPELAAGIRDFIAARTLDAGLAVTDGPGHATELARDAVRRGSEVVVAVGGDGTMNEVAQGLIGSPAALALVPCGSGNGLARHLGLPRTPAAALQLAGGAAARVRAIDTGTANGHPFINAMGLGLDAEVSLRFNRLTRRGLPAYARVAWSAWREFQPERVTLAGGGRRETCEALLVAVANSDQYGNNARIAPGARIDDGRLDLVVVKPVGLLRAAALVPRLFLGNLDASPKVLRLGAPSFTIERARPGTIHTDGETHATAARISVEVRPRSLRVLVPAGPAPAAAVPRRPTASASAP